MAEKDVDSPPPAKKSCRDTAAKRGPGAKGKAPAGTSATAPATTDLRALIRDTLQEVLKEQKDGAKAADATPAPPGKYSRLVCMGHGRGLARYIYTRCELLIGGTRGRGGAGAPATPATPVTQPRGPGC